MPYKCKCPECGEIWGVEELDRQECFYCGYPEGDIDDLFDDDEIPVPGTKADYGTYD